MVWDKTLPIEGALAPTYNNIMRDDKVALEAGLNAWFYFVTGGTQTCQPRQGSARPYRQADEPATRLDGDHFDSTDLGTPWIDSDDGTIYILTAADGAGTNTWSSVTDNIIAALLAAARTFADVVTFSVNPVFTEGVVANNSYIQSRNAADDGNVNLIKADGSDNPTLPDGAVLAAATESADGDRTICDLAYAKTGDTAMHDSEGGYTNADVDGTKTKVYTKYFTGTHAAGAGSTTVAHSITSGATKILNVTFSSNNGSRSYVADLFTGNSANQGCYAYFDDTNVVLVRESNHGGNIYRIKIDYIL